MGLALTDEVPDGRRDDHDLTGNGSAPAICGRHELLGHDTHQRGGQLNPHLLLLMRREHVDHTIDGLGRVLGVERSEDEVAGLRSGQGGVISKARLPTMAALWAR